MAFGWWCRFGRGCSPASYFVGNKILSRAATPVLASKNESLEMDSFWDSNTSSFLLLHHFVTLLSNESIWHQNMFTVNDRDGRWTTSQRMNTLILSLAASSPFVYMCFINRCDQKTLSLEIFVESRSYKKTAKVVTPFST